MRSLSVVLVALCLAAPVAAGTWGIPDQAPAASILVPFFEVGIDSGANPHDTLVTIYNRSGSRTLHWEIRDIDGVRVLNGNVGPISSAETWPVSLRDLINVNASPADRAALTQGDFYRGFMTIDSVTEETALSPFDNGYPFATANTLVGTIYYVRLLEGSANGLAAVHLEHVDQTEAHFYQEGFYNDNDDREEIDLRSRSCTAVRAKGGTCGAADTTTELNGLRLRNFLNPALNGQSRFIVFSWLTTNPEGGGPSPACDLSGTCNADYAYRRFDEAGNTVESRSFRLDHVVNVIEPESGDEVPGEVLLLDIEDPGNDMQIYAFAFNSASPAGNPNINWDAIFEGNLQINLPNPP